MLRFALGFPITVYPFFWISCILLSGALDAQTKEAWIFIALNTVAIFFSILTHEFGHAIAARIFGGRPEIILHAMGGVTRYYGAFDRWRRIIITSAGPLAGFSLGMLSLGASFFPPVKMMLVARTLVISLIWINFIWTFFNLLPIQPLDGGHILRDILGPKKLRVTSLIGGITASLVAVLMVLLDMPFMAIFCAYLAYLNFSHRPAGALGDEEL